MAEVSEDGKEWLILRGNLSCACRIERELETSLCGVFVAQGNIPCTYETCPFRMERPAVDARLEKEYSKAAIRIITEFMTRRLEADKAAKRLVIQGLEESLKRCTGNEEMSGNCKE